MFKNHLKVAIRNLLKQKVYSLINVTGLAIGMASCGVILLYIQKEISYDNYHQDIDQLYRVAIWKDATGQKQGGASVSYEMAEVLRHDYPEVVFAARLYQLGEPAVVKIDDRQFSENRFCFAEPSVFDIFTMRFLRGNREATLQKPNTVVVTEEIARKYFGTLDVLDKTLTVNLNNQNLDFKITGVVENPPPNTHFKYGLLASFENVLVAAFNPDFFKSWFNYPIWTYLKLQKGTRATDFEGKLAQVVEKYFPPTRKTSRLFLQPVRDIHLHSHLDDELEGNSDIVYIYIFSVIALLVLVIAGINFMNLTTAKSMTRAREVGMRKVLGAYRAQLIKQFLAEAMLVSGIAVVVALGLIELFLRLFKEIATINLELSYSKNMVWIIGFIVFALSAGLLSGVYPAFFLSAFRPIKTLKGAFSKSTRGGGLRKALVVFQMAITIALLVSIATISRQLNFVRHKKLGFQKEQMLLISVNGTALRNADKYDSFKNQILQMPEVKGVTTNSRSMGEVIRIRSIFFNGINESEKIALPYIFVGHDYATVYGLEFVEGRDFSKAFSTDTNWVYIVNESAVREYDLQPAVGRMIASGDLNPRRGQIVGVVKDFHFSTLHDRIEPLVIGLSNIPFGYISVKLESDALPRTLQQMETVWKRFEPDRPMEFSFLDEKLDQAYKFEAQLGKVVSYFTALAIFIACLGLFAMAAYAAEQRTKEIGIRKVLGASVAGLILLLSKDFTRLVLLGFAIAVPTAYFVMNRWLSDFAYRIELGPGIFLLAGGITLVIAWLTVSYQSIKAALANPVEALRYE